jgi:triacylglycerol esterase/lipase EstA (alpha/beta hydrolase family)
MGALAVRYFLQRQGGGSLVRRFISIAGPHHGTLTAFLRQNIGCRQMRPGSDLLRDLNSDMDPWGVVKVFSFWSPLDLTVIPATSSLLNQSLNRAFIVGLHPWMVSDKRVIAAVIQTLSTSH